MQRYKEIEHTADIGVEVYGHTLEELFQNAGYAFFDIIVDITTITPQIERTVHVSGNDQETLLLNWLRELLYLFSVYQEVYAEFEIDAIRTTELEAHVKGERLNLKKHDFHTEIKAITYHQFSVTNKSGAWQARMIFDV